MAIEARTDLCKLAVDFCIVVHGILLSAGMPLSLNVQAPHRQPIKKAHASLHVDAVSTSTSYLPFPWLRPLHSPTCVISTHS